MNKERLVEIGGGCLYEEDINLIKEYAKVTKLKFRDALAEYVRFFRSNQNVAKRKTYGEVLGHPASI